MAAIQNQQNQAAAQAGTQTSQNNYPSDNSYGNNAGTQSNNSETSTDAMHCVKVTYSDKGYAKFTNACSQTISIYWCVDRECATNNGRLERFRPGSSYPAMAEPGQDVKYAACAAPYGIGHRSESGGFNGSFTCKR